MCLGRCDKDYLPLLGSVGKNGVLISDICLLTAVMRGGGICFCYSCCSPTKRDHRAIVFSF